MPKQTPHIIELLRRWLRGDARAREERRMEQYAQDNKFLRDALEGYRRFPETDHEAASARMQERLRQRTAKKRGRAVPGWLPMAAAAAVALLVVTSLTWLFLWNGAQSDGTLAREESQAIEAIEPADKALADNAPVRDQEPSGPASSRKREEKTRSHAEPEALPEPTAAPPSEAPPAEVLADNAPPPESAGESDAGSDPPTTDKPAADDYPVAAAEEDTAPGAGLATAPEQAPLAALRATRGVPADTSARLLQGQILTPSGEPLVGANILFPGTTQGTVTGLDGAFSIQAPPGQQSFTVNYAGYKTATIPISSQDSFRITLEEGAPLSEVVVTGLNRAKTGERSLTTPKMEVAPTTAIPQGGFPNLKKYIRKNLQYPEEARRQGVEGIVLLQFTVQPDGNLIQFKVLQSLGHGCDKEAVRLLEKGPKWEVPHGQAPVIMTYPVRFELE